MSQNHKPCVQNIALFPVILSYYNFTGNTKSQCIS